MSNSDIHLPVQTVYKFMQDVLERSGVPLEDSRICADILITSDRRGIESHGISRLKMYVDRIKKGVQNPITTINIIRDNPTTAVWDGNHGMGHVIGYKAMQTTISKARQYGMGSIAVRNSSHYGIAGYYPLMAIQAGMIGMSFTNTRPSMAPTFGGSPMLGTNPIAFGAPTDEDCPFLFDAATTIIQRGKVEVSARKEKQLPDGWVVDYEGKYAHDPHLILVDLTKDLNALLPLGGAGEDFGGHKGYGLATVVEILSSCLQSGAFLHSLTGFDNQGKQQPYKVGHFFMAIDIELFLPLEEFKRNIGELLRELRQSTLAKGQGRIFTAGEKEYEFERSVESTGILIPKSLQNEMIILQNELQLADYKFPFQVV